MEKVKIKKEERGDVIEIYINPDDHPTAFARCVNELVECGLPRDEAERTVLNQKYIMEIFFEEESGMFAIESEGIDYIKTYNPYTGEEIEIC